MKRKRNSDTQHIVNVTKTYLPPIEEYIEKLRTIWESGILTNKGVMSVELEHRVADFLGVKNVVAVANGTLALQIALRALDISGEIITSPFSYVATVSAPMWERATPVFADIRPDTLTIDPANVRAAISRSTQAILATHVYGIPCDVIELQNISQEFDLPVIYDAAHAFGTRFDGRSVMDYGTISVLSFHATKLMHTGEGGALVTADPQLYRRSEYLRRFGHNGPEAFHGLGINAKLSELHAALGLTVLDKVPSLIEARRCVTEWYDDELSGSRVVRPHIPDGTDYNYAYYPVLFDSESVVLSIIAALKEKGIIPRRYFYPSLNRLDYVDYCPAPISEDIASRVLCLPLSHDQSEAQTRGIAKILSRAIS